ncbi:MAG: hypothetical protein JWQ96_71, partial [Segetibacter sp.]|nr:hypothetical protein [Segetibacter sp.]
INVVLQNQSTVSNAYVGLGPYRSEFYLMPPQNSFELGAINWTDLLSLHEYRHVQQYSNFNVGLSKVFSVLFGQEGQAFANGASVPDWFFEGDAVFNETALSTQGRGRIPDFFNGYQSLSKQGKKYSYAKLRNGSYRHFVPNHYELGYLLIAYGREKYGSDFWRKVTQDAASFKPLVYPLQGAVKKYSGISYRQFVNDAFAFYNQKWQQAQGVSLDYITPAHKNYREDYKYPYATENGDLIVLKTSYRKIPSIYRVKPNGDETKIGTRDIANDDYFSYNSGKIAFSSFKPDARWGYREYSNITIMDAATGSRQTITSKERLFSPDIAHNGQKIAAVEMKTNQVSMLVVIDPDGNNLFRSLAKRGVVYTHPKFSTTDTSIYTAVRNEDGHMSLLKVDLASGRETNLVPFANRIIGFPTVHGDTIIFSSSYKGSDEVWAFVESKNSLYRLAVNPTGLYQGTLQNGQLITSNFTADGYRLARIAPDALLWQKITEKENALPDLYVPGALKQENNATLTSIPFRDFPVSKYRKSTGLFNFHSWRPNYEQPELSFTLYGQNILNTLQTELYYVYNENEQSSRVGANLIYGGWYLQPFVGLNNTFNRVIRYNADTTLTYNDLTANAGLRLPLNLSGGRQYRFLTLQSSLNTRQIRGTGFRKNLVNDLDFNSLEARINYTGQVQKAVQHIYPHFAQTLSLQYRTIINKYTANQFLANGSLYLPGVHPSHSIVLNAAYQKQDTMRQYTFSNNFPFSRGYNAYTFAETFKVGANYHFPLLYPEIGFANIVYFNRIRANTFYDYTVGKDPRTGRSFPFNTVGGEMYFDTRWWNQQPVTFGIRYSRLLERYNGQPGQNQWEFILPINLFD